MNLVKYIGHPELLNNNSLYELRQFVARCPYHQVARLLMLENLFLLHDSTFDAELRKAALFVPDRTVLFDLVESLNYGFSEQEKELDFKPASIDRTDELIGSFLQSTAPESSSLKADPVMDYISMLEKMDDAPTPTKKNEQDEVVENFLDNDKGKVELPENPQGAPEETNNTFEGCITETLALIYIKQGRFEKAFRILSQINLDNSRKNVYFADQMRFLKKLVINERAGAQYKQQEN